MTEQEIYDGIARKDNKAFLFLYEKHQDMILRMVQKNNGNQEDALDLFQEGVIALWSNISRGKFQLRENARISTYLYALCRNLWISKLRNRKIIHTIDDNPALELAAETDGMEEEYSRIIELERQLEKLGDNCRKILSMFYYQKVSMKEIAEAMDITENTAKNNKYRCMERLRAHYQN